MEEPWRRSWWPSRNWSGSSVWEDRVADNPSRDRGRGGALGLPGRWQTVTTPTTSHATPPTPFLLQMKEKLDRLVKSDSVQHAKEVSCLILLLVLLLVLLQCFMFLLLHLLPSRSPPCNQCWRKPSPRTSTSSRTWRACHRSPSVVLFGLNCFVLVLFCLPRLTFIC